MLLHGFDQSEPVVPLPQGILRALQLLHHLPCFRPVARQFRYVTDTLASNPILVEEFFPWWIRDSNQSSKHLRSQRKRNGDVFQNHRSLVSQRSPLSSLGD